MSGLLKVKVTKHDIILFFNFTVSSVYLTIMTYTNNLRMCVVFVYKRLCL